MDRYYHAGGAYDPYVVVPTKAEAERDDRECKQPAPVTAQDFSLSSDDGMFQDRPF